MKTILKIIVPLCMSLFVSCEKFLDVPPPRHEVIAKSAFETEGMANSTLMGFYLGFSATDIFNINFYSSLSETDLQLYNIADVNKNQFYLNSLLSDNNQILSMWTAMYRNIFRCNSIIDGVKESNLSETSKMRLSGEAKFNRAFWYFYLVNLYGEVPLATKSLYSDNAILPRQSIDKIYQQIEQDLLDGQKSLSNVFVGADGITPTSERVRPNKWASMALLARVYMHTKKYGEAEQQADAVIKNTSLFELESDLDQVFLKNRKESIWQWQSFIPGMNTGEGGFYILSSHPSVDFGSGSSLSENLTNSFDANDKRKLNWIGYYNGYAFPYKYKVKFVDAKTENSVVLRLAEQYLIRAEARVRLGKVDDGRSDLNIIRSRAGLNPLTTNDPLELLKAISKEKKLEMFCEWGLNWIDMKRTGEIHDVMKKITPEKGGGDWQNYKQYWPVPRSELEKNPNLKQNEGYN